VVDQSHSFIGGATVRMGCVGIPVWRNHLLHKWGNYLIPYCQIPVWKPSSTVLIPEVSAT
jgi:hypothetical protein